jgi:serine/threonine protein kinase/Leucine-rich repeat (LRR) protein
MPVPLEQFIRQLEVSGILGETLKNFIPPNASPTDTEELAQELIRQNKLTTFQVQEINDGKGESLVLGNYVLMEKIGAGGMGQVFKARHRRMDRIVAIKLLPPATTKDPAAIARFEREVKAAAKITHPNIVAAHDADCANGVHFLVMELVDGADLAALVHKNGPFSVEKATNCILQAARGLEAAHRKGVIHRDIKPANLLMGLDGVVKILDMGLARFSDQEDCGPEVELTSTGAVMGTVDYMAPEQAVDTKTVDGRADIYSLGCTLHFLLTGRPTYKGDSFMNRLLAHRDQPIPSLRAKKSDIPDSVEAIFKKMVAKKVEDRYQTMSVVIADLERCNFGTEPTLILPSSSAPTIDLKLASILKDVEAKPTKVSPSGVAQSPSGVAQSPRANVRGRLLMGVGLLAMAVLAAVIVSQNTENGSRRTDVETAGSSHDSLDQLAATSTEQNQEGTAHVTPVTPPNVKLTNAKSVPRIKKPLAFMTPGFDQWIKETAALPAEEQVNAVIKKLQELNPGFDGKATHKIEGAVVTELHFFSDSVSDISPVRALPGLSKFACHGSYPRFARYGLRGKLADLSPLKGMQLQWLDCPYNPISDLTALAGMPLTHLSIGESHVTDISPLRGMKLAMLGVGVTHVSDLAPLQGMPLEHFHAERTLVTDLSPLSEAPLTLLDIQETHIADLSPIKDRPLQRLKLEYRPDWNTELLRSIKTLETINYKPPHEFWNAIEAYQARMRVPLAFLTPDFDQWVKQTSALPVEAQVKAVASKLQELNPGFDGKIEPTIENGLVLRLKIVADHITDISPVRAFKSLEMLDCSNSDWGVLGGLGDISPLKGMKLINLTIDKTSVADLSPLQGMKLTNLGGYGADITSLAPLRGMPLFRLNVGGNHVVDLSPLKECPLSIIHLDRTLVNDISPLKGLPIRYLACQVSPITDFAPLKEMPIKELLLEFDPDRDTELLSSIKTLETINDKPVADFWREFDDTTVPRKPANKKSLAFKSPGFDEWAQQTTALPAEEQINAVIKKLQELNPGFDGKVTYKSEEGAVTQLLFATNFVTDISPVRALKGLADLGCEGGKSGNGKLADLSPLEGMALQSMYFPSNKISNLSALKGMPLHDLYFPNNQVSDLSPLQGMPLKTLGFSENTHVRDLSPLRGMHLIGLGMAGARVADLSPLQGMPLEHLEASATFVTDLSPLIGMPLKWLNVRGTHIADFSLIKSLPLRRLGLEYRIDQNTKLLRSITTLELINDKPASEFYEAVEAYQANARIPRAFLSPTFDEWARRTAAQPVEVQVQSVASKMQELNPGFDGKMTPTIEKGVVTALVIATAEVTDISPVRALPGLKSLRCTDSGGSVPGGLGDLSPLKGLQLTELNFDDTDVDDLSSLRGMPLTSLSCFATKVADLSPLEGLPLTKVQLTGTSITDLSPLKKCPLSELVVEFTLVTDLSPLQGVSLTNFNCHKTMVLNLAPLKEIPIRKLWLDFNPNRDTELLRSIKTLETINDKPVADFWREFDVAPATKKLLAFQTPGFDEWIKKTSSLAAEEQVTTVILKLQELNPGFDGKMAHAVRDGAVTWFNFVTDHVTDISPVRAFTGLRALQCESSDVHQLYIGKLRDLSPLGGLKLESLYCGGNPVTDISVLNGMPLKELSLFGTLVSALAPLKGTSLRLINIGSTSVSDLSPLTGMPLESLDCNATLVTDLSPLKGMPLKTLGIRETHVFDESPLKEISLQHLYMHYTLGRDTVLLRSIATLETINDKPVNEFCEVVDRQKTRAQSQLAFVTPGFEKWAKQVAGLQEDEQVKAVAAKLQELNPGFDGHVTPTIENNTVTGFKIVTDHVTDISPVRAFSGLKSLQCSDSGWRIPGGLSDLAPLKGMNLTELIVDFTEVADLSPLRGMMLTNLGIMGTAISDLSPLKGMPLGRLSSNNNPISDLSPLKGCPLLTIHLDHTLVSDISPLQDMPLEYFGGLITKITDFSPLKNSPIKRLFLDFRPERDTELLRSIKTLETINDKPVADFWREFDIAPTTKKPLAFQTPGFDEWVKKTSSLPAAEQVTAVARKLQELNPGFDGTLQDSAMEGNPWIVDGEVLRIGFVTDRVQDISPLRAFSYLRSVTCRGGTKADSSRGILSDLSPLERLPLEVLNCAHNPVADLSALKNLPLVSANFYGTDIADLTPLEGKRLTVLTIAATRVSDLSPLKGMPLGYLSVGFTAVKDLTPLAGMPLESLFCDGTRVSNLSALKGMPLTVLHLFNTEVTDLSPIKDAKLTTLLFTPRKITCGIGYLHQKESIKIIGVGSESDKQWPPAEFWRKYYGGEFGPLTPAFESPVFRQWTKDVAALPAEEQVTAVAKTLQLLNPGFDGKVTHDIKDGVVVGLSFNTDRVTDISPVRALVGLKNLACGGSQMNVGRLADLSPLQGMSLDNLYSPHNEIWDLSPLAGMPLRALGLYGSPVEDLSPLQGLRLTSLDINHTRVHNLSPIADMPLETLWMLYTLVTDLSPLKGMPLRGLHINSGFPLLDVSPLAKLPLEVLDIEYSPKLDTKILRSIRTLTAIKGMPVVEFCDHVESRQRMTAPPLAFLEPAFEQWVAQVAAMPVDDQIKQVIAKLKEVNTEFDGQVAPVIENGIVTRLQLFTDHVPDLSPLRALKGLTSLDAGSTTRSAPGLQDVSPLAGLNLQTLSLKYTNVASVKPLAGMKLTSLSLQSGYVTDLSPLRGMPLTHLHLGGNPVTDLSPLKGCPLQSLYLDWAYVADLSPLEGMPLAYIDCRKTPVVNFSPLRRSPIKYLGIDFIISQHTDLVRAMRTLETVNDRPIAEIEERQPWRRLLAFQLPGFDQWVNETAQLPAKQQLEAVSRKLQELNPMFDGKLSGFHGATEPIVDGVVTTLKLNTDHVQDLSPLRVFSGLRSLSCEGSEYAQQKEGTLADLSPLRGMALQELNVFCNPIARLAPLDKMPIRELRSYATNVFSLEPLKEMPITTLYISHSRITDLSPLSKTPISKLYLDDTKVSSLAPLQGKSLQVLSIFDTDIDDLSPLQGMNLTDLRFTPRKTTIGIPILRQMKSLSAIGVGWTHDNVWPTDVFWKKYADGDFGEQLPLK